MTAPERAVERAREILCEFSDGMRWHPMRRGELDRFEVSAHLRAQLYRHDESSVVRPCT